ncbi:protein kinase domain-containing protein [Rhodococcus koreensis]
MSEVDPFQTQREPGARFDAELSADGFDNAQEIGRGGFGVVYRCIQPALDRTVAVKVLTSDLDPDNLERFLREQRAMGKLSGHPNIATILQIGTTGRGHPYLVMQLHPRGSLETLIRRAGPLDWKAVLALGVKLCGALEVAHRAGILHRDVKPGNILLTDYGEPLLTDFGIARMSGGFETTVGTVIGSPAFTAPEVLRGDTPTPGADVYSLGATLFCALTGHAAFERRSGEQLVAQFLRITSEPIPDLRGGVIPDPVCALLERAMATAADRPPSAAAFGDEVRQAQHLTGVPVDPMPLPGIFPLAAASGTVPETTGERTARVSKPPTGSRTPPPSPATKFRPPETARALITRERLLELLRAGESRRLIMIHAPTGYGKSILAAQWRRVLTEQGYAVAWLTVDKDDNNTVWFLAHLVEAIERVRPDVTGNLRQELEEHSDDAQRYVLTMLVDRIHESDRPILLILDDWHRVTASDTLEVARALLDEGCHHLQILVTSRTRTGLPLSRMQMRDELVEIDSADLRFDDNESRSFLVDVGGLDLTGNDVAALTETTDGWVAGLQLASLSLRGRADSTTLIERLTGRTHAIGEFLAENVLDNLDPATLDFLLTTSICERLCGSLATALTGNPRGQVGLEKVEEQDLFLRRADEDGRWFRYHHLFAEFLQQRLERDHPERITELHRLAADWFADHHFLNEAVDHALAAGDPAVAVELIENNGMDLLEHAQMSTLLGLIAKLPSRLVTMSYRLQLILAWANNQLLRCEPARTALERAEALLALGWVPESEIDDVRAEIGVVKAESLLYTDHATGITELVADALAQPENLRPWVVAAAAGNAAFAAVYSFDFDEARRIQRWASPYHDRASGPYNAIWGHCITGIAAKEQLDIAAAEAQFREGLRIAVDGSGPHSFAARLACALLGELLYERGELTEADRLLEESCALGSTGGADFMLGPYVIGARIKALAGEHERARARLDDGIAIATALELPRLRARIDNERIRLHLHDPAFPLPPAPNSSPARAQTLDGLVEIVTEFDESSAIMHLLADPTPVHTARACTRAEEAVARLAGSGRHLALLHANRLHLGCLAADNRIDEAQALLAALAAQCAPHRMSRYLVDAGPPITASIEALIERHRQDRWPTRWPKIAPEFLSELETFAATRHTPGKATRSPRPGGGSRWLR